jgi:hypothetical protein
MKPNTDRNKAVKNVDFFHGESALSEFVNTQRKLRKDLGLTLIEVKKKGDTVGGSEYITCFRVFMRIS